MVPRFVPIFTDQVERGSGRKFTKQREREYPRAEGAIPSGLHNQYLNPELKNNPLIHKAYLTTAYGNLELRGAGRERRKSAIEMREIPRSLKDR